ncbi:U-box domain-containing protein 1-like [Nicotiana sylvestris]|uniref:RING-type E3 ubiquitin transferase n=1 Tax=Nicotiana sylvestris TaxID=4096 RepID=A0A1U7YKW4_NICSY|nr:PREDICTED: U-box domain-containing protein 17-like [Nicotiana sylvestris]
MNELPLPLMVSSGFLPSGNLVETLIHISNEVLSMEKLPFLQVKNISTMVRRIKILSSLFEEIQETSSTAVLPPSSILCLTELFSVIRKVKLLIGSCKESSSLWNLMQTELISNQFHALMKEMEKALDILPLRLLHVTVDTKEQVVLLRKQAKRADLFIDPREIQKREEILQLMATNNCDKNSKNKGFIDFRRMKDTMRSIGLRSSLDYEEEISKLEAEAEKQAGTGGLIAISNINSLISLISLSKTAILEEHLMIKQNLKQPAPMSARADQSSSCYSVVSDIPDELRCPISLDLMRDPVIIASGHTYDRNSIAQWINSGHHTCPKSGQRLIHMALIPNYALKSLIHQWCQENNIPITEPTLSPSDSESSSSSKIKKCDKAIDYISATKAATDAVKMTAEFLVGKLATGSPDIQRQAAYELRLLAKTGMDNRRIIAESGAIPFLMTLLSSRDPRIQENAVTALLNLSIHENNKILIMSAGVIDSLIEVLQCGKTMEARENAAAAIFSLSVIDEYKVIIGARTRAIPALVGLLEEGTTAGKKDAAIALFNLAVYDANRPSIVLAGAIPLLINLLMDDKAGITDDALAVLALVLGCNEGLQALRKSRILVPLLVDLLRFGSSKGKDHSITLLLGLCKDSGEEVAGKLLMNPRSIPSLQSLAADGSLRARRKADALLRLLNRCCSQSQ